MRKSFFLILGVAIVVAVFWHHLSAQPLRRELVTRTGKGLVITETHPNGLSLSDVRVVSRGFKHEFDEVFHDVDPVTEAVITDLDEDGFDELYLVCTSAGSGSYGSILAFSSNRDLSLSMINFPEIEKGDDRFSGYMGHDRFTFAGHRMTRGFPIYRGSDGNNKPTGGTAEVYYELVPGEATRQLVIVGSSRSR